MESAAGRIPTRDEGRGNRLDLGCAIKHGAFEVAYPEREDILLDTSNADGALVYW